MHRIIWFFAVAATGVYICGPIVDPDLWWHITVGKWIAGSGTVPVVDYWNMFAAGTPWRAYSWSNELLFALVDRYLGIKGLLALKMLLGVLLSFTLFYVFGRTARDWFFGGMLGIFSTAACFNHFTLRPQTLVWIFFALLLYLSSRIEKDGFSASRRLGLFLIMTAWANTHLTTALGLLAVIGWLVKTKGKAASEQDEKGLLRRQAVVIKAAIICFLGTLVTPYGGTEWLTFFSKTDDPFRHAAVAEFHQATILQYSTAFLIIAVVLLLLFLHKCPKALSVPKLLVWGAFIAAALAIIKFLPFAVIFTCMLAAEIWGKQKGDPSVLGDFVGGIERLNKAVDTLIDQGGSALAFCLLGVIVFYGAPVWRAPLSYELTPVEAVDFIIDNNLEHPILNDFGKGGYLMYRFSDSQGNLEHKVPIDGRTNVNPPEVWIKFHASLQGQYNWKEYIDLVKPETILWRNESSLTSLLLVVKEWERVYCGGAPDRGYSIFIKKDALTSGKYDLPSADCAN